MERLNEVVDERTFRKDVRDHRRDCRQEVAGEELNRDGISAHARAGKEQVCAVSREDIGGVGAGEERLEVTCEVVNREVDSRPGGDSRYVRCADTLFRNHLALSRI
jgi:hypothetical protein